MTTGKSAMAEKTECATRFSVGESDGYRFSGYLFSRLTDCAVSLTLVYVAVATLDSILRDAYFTTVGLVSANGATWPIDDALRSVMWNQVTYFRLLSISLLSPETLH
jgi:hypothetical protein